MTQKINDLKPFTAMPHSRKLSAFNYAAQAEKFILSQ